MVYVRKAVAERMEREEGGSASCPIPYRAAETS